MLVNIEEAEIELYLRKYQWALTDLTREIKEGCPFLRTLSDPGVQRFLRYTQSFSTTEQLEFAVLNKKNAYRPALQLLGETLSQEEETKLKIYQAGLTSLPLQDFFPLPITKTFAVKRADAAKTVLSFMSSNLGSKPKKVASLDWFYSDEVGDWKFYTNLDFSGTWGTEIRCYHSLIRGDGKNWGQMPMPLSSAVGTVVVPQAFSLLTLYSLSAGVYYIHNVDGVEIVAQAILDSYNHLFRAIPGWVDGISGR